MKVVLVYEATVQLKEGKKKSSARPEVHNSIVADIPGSHL